MPVKIIWGFESLIVIFDTNHEATNSVAGKIGVVVQYKIVKIGQNCRSTSY